MDQTPVGFKIPNLMFTGKFRIVRFMWRHRNLKTSLPLLKRNTGMLIKANLKRSKNIIRNISEAFAALESVVDQFFLNKLPQRWVKNYMIISPFVSEAVSLIPVFIVYNCPSDLRFVELHRIYGVLRTFYIGFKPVRLLFSAAMIYNFEVSLLFFDFVRFNWLLVDRLASRRLSFWKVRKITILVLASLAEIFGEPYGKPIILVKKPVLFMVAKNSTIDKDLVLPSPDCIQVPLADLKGTEKFQNRQILRVRSQVKARKIKDSIKRIALF